MLRYPCLVLDHDDTVVRTEETINYPCFCQYLEQYHPDRHITLREYIHGCFSMGFVDMCKSQFGFSEEEATAEYQYWQEYIRSHIPQVYPGIGRIIRRQKEQGGLICVVSHSSHEIITRDYQTHFGILPDAIYGWDMPKHQRKPHPYPLTDIMDRFGLSPAELLVIDDMTPGWEMAKAAQVQIAFSAWGRQEYPEILSEMRPRCDFSFDSTEALEKFLFD